MLLRVAMPCCAHGSASQLYDYAGESTCAADGMCQEKCPVKINTGELIKSLRAEHMKDDKFGNSVAMVGPMLFRSMYHNDEAVHACMHFYICSQ